MASTWTGSALVTRYCQELGLRDTASRLRVLAYLNVIQRYICSGKSWPFLKIRLKKQFVSGEQELDFAPQIPSAATIALLAGGALEDASVYKVKVTFIIFDSTNKEENSIESEPSAESNAITVSGADLSLTLTNLATYTDANSYEPTSIYRRIYLSKDGGDFILYGTVANNTATTTTITADSSSTIEPPMYSMADRLSVEDPFDRATSTALTQKSQNQILQSDPALTSSGTPTTYARIGDTKVLVHPKLSTTKTYSYSVIRKPSRIFDDANRVIQLNPSLEVVLDAGMTWKNFEYKDSDGQESKRNNFFTLLEKEYGRLGRISGRFGTIREVE